jgi:hypothetical protein
LEACLHKQMRDNNASKMRSILLRLWVRVTIRDQRAKRADLLNYKI